MRAAVTLTLVIAVLGLFLPAMAQAPPPYIQPGIMFVYQMFDLQKQQPENAFHRYIIESITPQGIRIAIQSDVIKSGVVTVNSNGEFAPGNRIDLWIPPGLSAGARLKMMGVDAVVAQTGFDFGQGLKVTLVVSADQTIVWYFAESGPQQIEQYKGLLLGIMFPSQKKGLGLVNIQQAGPVTTTSTYTTTTPVRTTTAYTTPRTTVVDGTTVTTVITESRTVTVASTITTSTVSTYTTTITSTNTVQPDPIPSPIPLSIAVPVAAVIIGGSFFYIRSRGRPLPPTYPYPSYPMPPPGYQPQPPTPPAYQQSAMACPACRFPVYPGEFVCRRCGFRVR